MPTFNSEQIVFKVVYYGPGLSGKTTNLEVIHLKTPVEYRSDFKVTCTPEECTLYFDLLTLEEVNGMKIKMELFTIPGAIHDNFYRFLTLKQANGIIFVADSQVKKIEENLAYLEDLKTGLKHQGIDFFKIPIVMQWNKRDMPNIYSVDELEIKINTHKVPSFEAIAPMGIGVFDCLKKLHELMISNYSKEREDNMS